MILGLDISTSITGFCVIDADGEIIRGDAWDMRNKNKFKTLASGFGYLLHQKWNEYKCVIFVDSDLEEGKANGRTGKSLVLDDALSHALESVTVEADSLKKDRSSKFLFHGVNQSTQYICLDDACKDFEFSTLFSKITGPFTC